MTKEKIYNIVGILSTIILISSMLGNFFKIEDRILNILLFFGV